MSETKSAKSKLSSVQTMHVFWQFCEVIVLYMSELCYFQFFCNVQGSGGTYFIWVENVTKILQICY